MKTSLTPRIPPLRSLALASGLALLTLGAAPVEAETWNDRKCALYQGAFDDALAMRGADGLRPEFLDDNAQFVQSGCTTQGYVCPQTPQELALADMLTVMTMNEGMASTFVPFGCKPRPESE